MFYKESWPSKDGTTRYSAYDHADRISDAVEAYKRCRKRRTFVLNDDSPDLERLECGVCGRKLNDYGDAPEGYRGNRIDYSPRNRTFIAKHYMCAWNVLLGAICTSYSVAEAGVKYQKMQGKAQKV